MFGGMKYVYEVYKEMSFSKAAKNLFISQPSLSAAIKKEEAEAGFPIFDRSTNPIRLTELGKEYIRSAEMIMDIENGFCSYVDEVNGLKVGEFSVGATNLFASYVLPPLLTRYMERYPSIKIKVTEGTTAELTEALTAGSIDLMIDNMSIDESIYEKKVYCNERLLLTVPAERVTNARLRNYAFTADDIKKDLHLTSRIPAVSPELFWGEPFLMLSNGNDTRKRADAICHAAKFTPDIRLEVGQQITAYNMSARGLGISFNGDVLIRHVPSDLGLLYYKLDDLFALREVNFYYRRNRYLSGAVKAFLDLIG